MSCAYGNIDAIVRHVHYMQEAKVQNFLFLDSF